MDKLFPIIRRKRRPFVAEELPSETPSVPEKIEPVQTVVTAPPFEPVKVAKPRK